MGYRVVTKVVTAISKAEIVGPFGPARKVDSMPVADILAAYRRKCGVDVAHCFENLSEVDLYECQSTGYRFWRPERIAADEEVYRLVSTIWPNYYDKERWEYRLVRKALRKTDSVLEVGCGRGYFLRSIEGLVDTGLGLELNAQAVKNKITKFDVRSQTIEVYAARMPASLDVVCGFQILEHMADPGAFIRSCIACLRPGGLLFLSTPNRESAMLQNYEDAFDMPPHHLGHFSKETYHSIARDLGIDLLSLWVEPRRTMAVDTLSEATRRHILYRKVRALTTGTLDVVYRLLGEPGNNILVAFRKPGEASGLDST